MIIQYNGRPVEDNTELVAMVMATKPGTSVPVTAEGNHTLSFWSTDKAGNAEAAQEFGDRIAAIYIRDVDPVTEDPRDAHKKPPFHEETQERPGSEAAMNERPDHGAIVDQCAVPILGDDTARVPAEDPRRARDRGALRRRQPRDARLGDAVAKRSLRRQ